MKHLLLILGLCLISCNGYEKRVEQAQISARQQMFNQLEQNIVCKLSSKFNNRCLCVWEYGYRGGFAFVSQDICDGNEEGAIP